jgi:Primase C terminal 1 (PriCT-1)
MVSATGSLAAATGEGRDVRAPDDPAAALDALACAVRDAPAGNRNNVLFWAACRAVEEFIRLDITEAVLGRAALKAGLDPAEVDTTIDSAFKHQRVVA